MRYAIIENDEVINVIVADSDEFGGVECGDEIYAGYKYVKCKFIAPPIVYGPVIDETETLLG